MNTKKANGLLKVMFASSDIITKHLRSMSNIMSYNSFVLDDKYGNIEHFEINILLVDEEINE